MHLQEAGKSRIIKGTVGTGGVTKGDMCVLSSNTFIRITDAPSGYIVVAIATKSAVDTAVGEFELVSDAPICTAKFYTGGSKKTLTDADISKVFDVYDSQTIDLDDTTGGCFFCVGYDNDLALIHFIVIPANRAV